MILLSDRLSGYRKPIDMIKYELLFRLLLLLFLLF